jgi:hypothetical protein
MRVCNNWYFLPFWFLVICLTWLCIARRTTGEYLHAANKRKLLVVSVGGVGTTYFMTTIASSLATWYAINDWRDFDGLKHACSSPKLWGKMIRGVCMESTSKICNSRGFGLPTHVIYLLGDPEAALFSHLGRGSAGVVYAHLHDIPRANVSMVAPWASAPNVDKALIGYMAATAALGEDAFGIRLHFESWKSCVGCPAGTRILFTSLARAAERPVELERFLEVPLNTLHFQFSPSLRTKTVAPLTGVARKIMQNLTALMLAADGSTLQT